MGRFMEDVYTRRRIFLSLSKLGCGLQEFNSRKFHLHLKFQASGIIATTFILIETLRNHDGNGNENVALKYKFALLVLLRDYSNFFNLNNAPELSSNRKVGKGVQVERENKKCTVMCSHSPQNLEFGHFTLLFGLVRQRNVPKVLTHVQGLCFCHSTVL